MSAAANAGRGWLAVLLVLIYAVLTPALGALVGWLHHLATASSSGLIRVGNDLGFWLILAFAAGAPVLLAASLVHFLARRQAFVVLCAKVIATGIAGWTVMALLVDRTVIVPFNLAGLLLLVFALGLGHWCCRRLNPGNLP